MKSIYALDGKSSQSCYLNLLAATVRGRENLLTAAGVDSLDSRQRRVVLKIRLATEAAYTTAGAVLPRGTFDEALGPPYSPAIVLSPHVAGVGITITGSVR